MSFPRYPKYKPTGVEWLGEVPERWVMCAVGYRYEVALGKMLDAKAITGKHLAPYLRNSDVQWGAIRTDDLNEMDFDPADRKRFSLEAGDLLVCEGGEVGRCAVWDARIPECYYQKALHRVRPLRHDRDTCRLLRWQLQAAVDLGAFAADETKATIAHLPAEAFRSVRLPFPAPEEQHAIAAFLDRETAKIDALVAEQERLIELLAEKRQAVISHAVTKGLNPDAPMKPSGVEWLGEVPAHWKVTKVKHLAHSIEQGWSPQCDGFPVETEADWGILKVGCVNGGVFNPAENKALPPQLEAIPSLAVSRGDLLISRANTRELVGSAAVADRDHPNLMLCDKLYRLRFRNDRCVPSFVSRYLASTAVRGRIELEASGASASMVNIPQSAVMELTIGAPPFEEQDTVTAFLDRAVTQFDSLMEEATHATTLLQERRSALISAAVTGQIDVRNAVATGAA